MTGLNITIAELYRAYGILNDKYFQSKLVDVQITIQRQDARTKNVLGWITVGKVWTTDKTSNSRHEINITPEHLTRGTHDILRTLLHEMCHLINMQNNIQDVSSHNYHNKHFKAIAEAVGLIPTYDKINGWSWCEISDSLREIFDQIDLYPEAFSMYRQTYIPKEPKTGTGAGTGTGDDEDTEEPGTGKRGGKQKTKMKKWSCDCTNVRCAVELMALCGKCLKPFTLQS